MESGIFHSGLFLPAFLTARIHPDHPTLSMCPCPALCPAPCFSAPTMPPIPQRLSLPLPRALPFPHPHMHAPTSHPAPAVRTLEAFEEAVLLCDVKQQGWPIKFVNGPWCSTTGGLPVVKKG